MSTAHKKKERGGVTSTAAPDTRRRAIAGRASHDAGTIAEPRRKRKPGAGRPAKGYVRMVINVPSGVTALIKAAAATERVTPGEAVAKRFA